MVKKLVLCLVQMLPEGRELRREVVFEVPCMLEDVTGGEEKEQ